MPSLQARKCGMAAAFATTSRRLRSGQTDERTSPKLPRRLAGNSGKTPDPSAASEAQERNIGPKARPPAAQLCSPTSHNATLKPQLPIARRCADPASPPTSHTHTHTQKKQETRQKPKPCAQMKGCARATTTTKLAIEHPSPTQSGVSRRFPGARHRRKRAQRGAESKAASKGTQILQGSGCSGMLSPTASKQSASDCWTQVNRLPREAFH